MGGCLRQEKLLYSKGSYMLVGTQFYRQQKWLSTLVFCYEYTCYIYVAAIR